MKIILEFLKLNYVIILLLIIFLVVAFYCKMFIPKPLEAIDSKTTILFQLDSSRIQKEVEYPYRTILVNLLQEREANFINSLSSRDSVRMESRLFYCAIITGLISLFFIKDNKDKIKKYTSYFLLMIIVLLYFVDVHQGDLIERNLSDRIVTGKAINQLVKPFDNKIYELSYDSVNVQYEKATKLYSRWSRKLYNACCPDLSQIVYFIIPLILVFLNTSLIFPNRSRKTDKIKYRYRYFS